MWRPGKREKGAFSLEYALIICLIVAALVGMSIYLIRSVCDKWRDAADSIGFGRQFDPKITK